MTSTKSAAFSTFSIFIPFVTQFFQWLMFEVTSQLIVTMVDMSLFLHHVTAEVTHCCSQPFKCMTQDMLLCVKCDLHTCLTFNRTSFQISFSEGAKNELKWKTSPVPWKDRHGALTEVSVLSKCTISWWTFDIYSYFTIVFNMHKSSGGCSAWILSSLTPPCVVQLKARKINEPVSVIIIYLLILPI